ncbi:hypothetical protein T12_14096, partial [Trichinella patagoniensis]
LRPSRLLGERKRLQRSSRSRPHRLQQVHDKSRRKRCLPSPRPRSSLPRPAYQQNALVRRRRS